MYKNIACKMGYTPLNRIRYGLLPKSYNLHTLHIKGNSLRLFCLRKPKMIDNSIIAPAETNVFSISVAVNVENQSRSSNIVFSCLFSLRSKSFVNNDLRVSSSSSVERKSIASLRRTLITKMYILWYQQTTWIQIKLISWKIHGTSCKNTEIEFVI